ncbi:MAG: ketol-acid reductoisomerase [Proteobacteria bacterium]|nr:ketol-acid reductoisomerase [Pseudomonadota bacterium]
MNIKTDKDCDLKLIQSRRVAIIGYGNQGRAQALNLRDSGVDGIVVGSRGGTPAGELAAADGFSVLSFAGAVKLADVIVILLPDEVQGEVYKEHIAPNLQAGAALVFGHGFSIHFKLIEPAPNLDVILAAPKGPGKTLRALYREGLGMPCVIGIHQDASGSARALALSYAAALGSGRSGILESSFREECETDLFSEQAILCGGLPALVKAGYEILVEAGYSPELAYIECLHEVKQIADLMWQGGLDFKNQAISNTAEFGGYLAGERLVDEKVRAEMKTILADIQSGRFAKTLMADHQKGFEKLKSRRAEDAAHEIEKSGLRVRNLMPWLQKKGD